MSAEEIKRVEHPDYYNQGRVECIDLLDRICYGYKGVFAFDIGQCKYIYRAGDKSEAGIDNSSKAIEDFKKMKFYMTDFYNRAEELINSNNESNIKEDVFKSKIEAELIANEFILKKKDSIKSDVKKFIMTIYDMKHLAEARDAINILDVIIKKLEEENGR